MSDYGQWITGTSCATRSRSEFEVIGDYLDADESAQAAGLVLGYECDGAGGLYTLAASAPRAGDPEEFSTITEAVAYIDGYVAGKVAARG